MQDLHAKLSQSGFLPIYHPIIIYKTNACMFTHPFGIKINTFRYEAHIFFVDRLKISSGSTDWSALMPPHRLARCTLDFYNHQSKPVTSGAGFTPHLHHVADCHNPDHCRPTTSHWFYSYWDSFSHNFKILHNLTCKILLKLVLLLTQKDCSQNVLSVKKAMTHIYRCND